VRFSVIINTDNRAASLSVTLAALCHLDHQDFEVIVVTGPTEDGTEAVLAPYQDRIKVGRCPERNLSRSRNIGLAMASGEVVCFIDDDAYPDPAWLDQLEAAYCDDEVVAVGGPVWDWTGARYQVVHSWANRLGDVWVEVATGYDPSPILTRPQAATFTYPIGTNASFRRDRLVQLGGFDEEFDYGWDEVDLCHRLIDQGHAVAFAEGALVYHKALPSEIRSENRATRNMRVLLKNKAYYTFKHGWGVAPLAEIAQSLARYAQHYWDEIGENVERGLLEPADLERYEADVVEGFDAGFAAWRRGQDRRRPPAWFEARHQPFVPFGTLRPRSAKLHLCFFSVEYPPEPVNGIGRVIAELATGLGRRGHEVHVLTRGTELDRVDFQDDVWVHRLVPRRHPRPEGLEVTQGLWDYAATLADEVRRIHRQRPVDLVQAPNWGTEGIAVLCEGQIPLVVGLYTPLATVAELDSPLKAGRAQGDPEVPILIELERLTYRRAPHFLACGPAIVAEIESAYGVTLGDRVGYVPHGITDRAGTVEPAHWEGRVEVLFVGRLEDRKGIDTLLAAIPRVVAARPEVGFTIVGEDARPMADGLTHRQRFEASPEWPQVADHVRFCSRVDDEQLWRLYAGCDLFVAPSRYESFGLILLEAMMFAKPVVACAVGGMTEIVDESSGLLVPPGDVAALTDALIELIGSPERRAELGRGGRARFERHYRAEAMVEGVNRYFDAIVGRRTATAETPPTEAGALVHRSQAGAGAPPAGIAAASPTDPTHQVAATTQGLQLEGDRGHGVAADTPQRSPGAGPSPARPVPGSGGRIGLTDLGPTLMARLACPSCRSPVTVVPSVLTASGAVKTGRIDCLAEARPVGAVEQCKVDFLAPPPELADHPPVVVPDLGELRIPADDPRVERSGTWVPGGPGILVSPGVIGDRLSAMVTCTDVMVRVRRQPTGGMLDVAVDGVPAASVDLFCAEGSESLTVRVAADLALAPHQVELTARGQAHPRSLGREILVEELVCYGPLASGLGFLPPTALNRGNPYSPYLDRWLDQVPLGEPVLEFGGGDRRRGRPGQVNFEFLKFELADGYGDIHAIPFADDTFAATWTQAVFEHIDDPFRAAAELIRVTRPGGLILTEVAFLQPLHAVPYHFFNMTTWGVQALFAGCEVLECDWFGELSGTIEWLTRASGLAAKVDPAELDALLEQFRSYDRLLSHEELRGVASAVYLVARKPEKRLGT